jgi:hypothetical protein
MVLSSLRLAAFLKEHSVSCRDYDIFLQATIRDSGDSGDSAMHLNTTGLRPSMHHPFHVDDFKFGFDSTELGKYNQIIRDCRHRDLERRESLRGLCNEYTERQRISLGLQASSDILNSLEELITANSNTRCKSLIVGGPFTEAFLFLEKTPGPKRIVAMAGSRKMDRNLFKNVQFNFLGRLSFR